MTSHATSSTPSAGATGLLLTADQLADALRVRDLTDPRLGPHAVQHMADRIVTALVAAWGCDQRLERRSPIVPVEDNYERLGYAADAVTRDARYTRYVSETCMLRSHSSAGIPPALRALAAESGDVGDVLVVCPGMAYRRDVVGRYHTGTPHQLDLWRVTLRPLGREDLLGMVGLVLAEALPGMPWRTVATAHPYTTGGLQIDVAADGHWVEVGECGVAASSVLHDAGLPENTSGLAMGLGLDRLVMLRKGVPDIRLLRSADPAVAGQMADLSPYRPVSHMPAVRRDLSIAWPATEPADDELLGAQVREAMGAGAECLEDVSLVSVTSYDDLPPGARDRIGLREGQVNLLVRLVLRDLDRTLTDREANELRDRAYDALHHGSVHQWTAPPPHV